MSDPLASLTPEQLEVLITRLSHSDFVGEAVKNRRQPSVSLKEELFWYFQHNGYDTVVAPIDASTMEEAIDVAFSPLQAWYVQNNVSREETSSSRLTRNQYIDWVKRGVK